MKQTISLNAAQKKFQKLVNRPFLFSIFLFLKLPAAWIAGVSVSSLTTEMAKVRVKMKWLNQNPFKSIYFAVLAMAAEMSTGLLCMLYTQDETRSVSMLVTNVNAVFKKKAVGAIQFVCLDGEKAANAITTAKETAAPVSITLKSIGYDANHVEIAEFEFTWSFKLK